MPKTRREQAHHLLAKADIDLRTAEVCLQHGEDAEPVCFHAQQAAEKILKAALLIADTPYPLTHNLGELLLLAVRAFPQLAEFEESLPGFTVYAVALRYDEMIQPDRLDAEEALSVVKRLNAVVRAAV
jgi:HEPN domain-containing protein